MEEKKNSLEKKNNLDERKRKVLQAIVEEYINTAEPVSSHAILDTIS